MHFQTEIYQLEIDAERTAKFYREAGFNTCDCDECRNFALAVAHLPEHVVTFLRQFGIDPAKPAEMSGLYAPSDDTIFYNGFYHICGTIVKGTNAYIQVGEKSFELDPQYTIELDRENIVYFTPDIHLLEDDFPTPAFQMECCFILPWLLSKPNPYD